MDRPSRISAHVVFALLALVLAIVAFQPARPKGEAGPRSVSVPEAIALIDGGAVLIDVRERSVSAAAHLPGAMLVPLETLSAQMPQIEAVARKDSALVVYCGNGSTRGPEAARKLRDAGYTRTVNLAAGAEGWRAAGMPVVN
jgi:rhodanese-related sulfurtransferase